MKYLIYRTDNGELVSEISAPADVAAANCPPGHSLLEVPDSLSSAKANWMTHKVVSGALVAHATPRTFPFPEAQWNASTAAWVDNRTLAQVKSAKWESLKQVRSLDEYAPITVGGQTFLADQESQAKITSAILLALINGDAWTVNWTLANGSSVSLTKAQLLALGNAVGSRTMSIYEYGRARKADIDAASSTAAVDAITWNYA